MGIAEVPATAALCSRPAKAWRFCTTCYINGTPFYKIPDLILVGILAPCTRWKAPSRCGHLHPGFQEVQRPDPCAHGRNREAIIPDAQSPVSYSKTREPPSIGTAAPDVRIFRPHNIYGAISNDHDPAAVRRT